MQSTPNARDKIKVTDIVVSTNHGTSLTNRFPRLISLLTCAMFVSGTSSVTAILKYKSVNPIYFFFIFIPSNWTFTGTRRFSWAVNSDWTFTGTRRFSRAVNSNRTYTGTRRFSQTINSDRTFTGTKRFSRAVNSKYVLCSCVCVCVCICIHALTSMYSRTFTNMCFHGYCFFFSLSSSLSENVFDFTDIYILRLSGVCTCLKWKCFCMLTWIVWNGTAFDIETVLMINWIFFNGNFDI